MPNLSTIGDPLPEFVSRSPQNEKFTFNTIASRYIVLSRFVSAGDPRGLDFLKAINKNRRFFDDDKCMFFGISNDPEDEATKRVRNNPPGIRFFWDHEGSVSRQIGILDHDESPMHFRLVTYILSPRLQVMKVIETEDPEAHVSEICDFIYPLPWQSERVPGNIQAPVLVVPNVFEPEFCRELIGMFDADGGKDSGYMTVKDGRTVGVIDHKYKKRMDYDIEDPAVRQLMHQKMTTRLMPQIERALMFKVTQIERYWIGLYEAESNGHFNPHRDNTTPATAHRKFACSMNLNAEEFEGGELRFPEFGNYTYKAPTGGAVIFACSLLHEATPVTKGKRYAFLPFLFDEEGARIREENKGSLVTNKEFEKNAEEAKSANNRASLGKVELVN